MKKLHGTILRHKRWLVLFFTFLFLPIPDIFAAPQTGGFFNAEASTEHPFAFETGIYFEWLSDCPMKYLLCTDNGKLRIFVSQGERFVGEQDDYDIEESVREDFAVRDDGQLTYWVDISFNF